MKLGDERTRKEKGGLDWTLARETATPLTVVLLTSFYFNLKTLRELSRTKGHAPRNKAPQETHPRPSSLEDTDLGQRFSHFR